MHHRIAARNRRTQRCRLAKIANDSLRDDAFKVVGTARLANKQRNSAPLPASSRATWLPTNPVAPVRKTFIEDGNSVEAWRLSSPKRPARCRCSSRPQPSSSDTAQPRLPNASRPPVLAKLQPRNLGIANRKLLIRSRGIEPHHRILKRLPRLAVEDIALDLRPSLRVITISPR